MPAGASQLVPALCYRRAVVDRHCSAHLDGGLVGGHGTALDHPHAGNPGSVATGAGKGSGVGLFRFAAGCFGVPAGVASLAGPLTHRSGAGVRARRRHPGPSAGVSEFAALAHSGGCAPADHGCGGVFHRPPRTSHRGRLLWRQGD